MDYLYELKPQYDSAKSFYKKANVYKDDKGKLLLMSYTTIVAEITDAIATEDGKPHLKVNGWYSNTTARHINEFAQQYGFNKMNKKEMEGEVK
jgi:hypothetical protein